MLLKLRQQSNKASGHQSGAMFLTLRLGSVFSARPSLIALHDRERRFEVVMGATSLRLSLEAPTTHISPRCFDSRAEVALNGTHNFYNPLEILQTQASMARRCQVKVKKKLDIWGSCRDIALQVDVNVIVFMDGMSACDGALQSRSDYPVQIEVLHKEIDNYTMNIR